MNAVVLARRLAGLATTIHQGRPTAEHWIAALVLAAQAEPVQGQYREVAFTAGRAIVLLHPLKASA